MSLVIISWTVLYTNTAISSGGVTQSEKIHVLRIPIQPLLKNE